MVHVLCHSLQIWRFIPLGRVQCNIIDVDSIYWQFSKSTFLTQQNPPVPSKPEYKIWAWGHSSCWRKCLVTEQRGKTAQGQPLRLCAGTKANTRALQVISNVLEKHTQTLWTPKELLASTLAPAPFANILPLQSWAFCNKKPENEVAVPYLIPKFEKLLSTNRHSQPSVNNCGSLKIKQSLFLSVLYIMNFIH